MLRSFDGAGYKLRKESNKKGEIEELLGGLHFPTININGIAHGLERVKGDAKGEDDVEEMGFERKTKMT
jgi:hypothetical protein